MSKKNNIIEINGHRYDARSGVRLGQSESYIVQASGEAAFAGNAHHAGQVITPTDRPSKQHPPRRHVALTQASKEPAKGDSTRRPAHNLTSRHQQPAKTLMRQAVIKPPLGLKRRIKAQGRTDTLVEQPKLDAAAKLSVRSIDAKRLRHAREVSKSQLISRFSRSHPVIESAADAQPSTTSPVPVPVHRPAMAVKTTVAKHPKTTADLLQQVLRQTSRA